MIEILNCAALLMLAFVPLLNDAVNFVLTPSNATVSVCAVPLPTEVILIAVKLAAFDADVAGRKGAQWHAKLGLRHLSTYLTR